MFKLLAKLVAFINSKNYGYKTVAPLASFSFQGKRQEYPICVMDVISNVPSETKDGTSTVDFYRVRIEVISKKLDDCITKSDQLRVDLDFTTEIDGVTVKFNDQSTDYDASAEVFIVQNDYICRSEREAIPTQVFTDEFTKEFE
jgi:hypothetical protein